MEDNEFGFEYVDSEDPETINTTKVDYDPNRYRVIQLCDVLKRCKTEVKRVKDIVGDTLSENEIRALLNGSEFCWDIEKFLEKFYTDEKFLSSVTKFAVVTPDEKENEYSGDLSKQNTSRRIMTRSNTRKRDKSYAMSNSQEQLEQPKRRRNEQASDILHQNKNCEICFDSLTEKEFHTWLCGHEFCNGCFKGYLIEKIVNSGLTAIFQCPGFQCSVLLPDAEITKALDDNTHLEKYMQIITNQYVQSKRMLRWCPGKECTNAIEVFDTVKQPGIRCLCGNFFCFSCGFYGHDLISCDLVKKFEVLKSSDFATAHWIAENCKQCPKCKAEINKNGGCNHMTCKNCRHEFCWICFENWNTHMANACKGAKIDEKKNGTKVSNRRLVACVSKFENMIDSIGKDEVNYKKYIAKQEQTLAEEFLWYRVDFIKEATDLILKCRQLLCDSYILEFFMENPNNVHWVSFELSQRDLMQRTEALSSMMEHDITSENMHDMKQKLHTHVVCCNSLYNAVYEKAKDGFQYDLWNAPTTE